MKPPPFAYHAPATVDEAVALLAQVAPEDGRVLAGGQSLVPIMNFRLAAPAHLVDINGVEGLDRLREEGGALVVPACVRHADFETGTAASGPLGALMAEVAGRIAHRPVRTRGTFCGSLAHADPASEWALAAATLGATLVARSVRGPREIAASDFFEGIMSTALAPDELLLEARLPLLAPGDVYGFYEVCRRAGDFAMAASLVVWRDDGGTMADVRLGVGGAESFPRRIPEAEIALAGRTPGDAAFRAAADAAADALSDVLEDARTNADFRRDLVRVVVRRALERSAP